MTDFAFIIVIYLILSVEIVFLRAIPLELKRNKKAERARARGNVVKAYKIKDLYRERLVRTNLSRAEYEYEVDGEKHRYYFSEYTEAPQLLELYWLRNPRNVFPDLPRPNIPIYCLMFLFLDAVAVFCYLYIGGTWDPFR